MFQRKLRVRLRGATVHLHWEASLGVVIALLPTLLDHARKHGAAVEARARMGGAGGPSTGGRRIQRRGGLTAEAGIAI